MSRRSRKELELARQRAKANKSIKEEKYHNNHMHAEKNHMQRERPILDSGFRDQGRAGKRELAGGGEKETRRNSDIGPID